MRLPKNWKNPTDFFFFPFVLFFVGCPAYTVNVRPSFDKDYQSRFDGSGSNVRVSYKQKSVKSTEENVSLPKDEDENESIFETEPRKITETPDESIRLRGGEIKKAADKYLGSPYYYGGTTKRGFDCSGFVWRVYQDIGYKSFSREPAHSMFNRGKSVSQNSLREGDLCFFYLPRNHKKVDHVGIYINDGKFIHSSSSSGVTYSKLSDNYWKDNFAGFKRLLP
jgi:cell wall-associated NlpC family hydrolase